MNKDVMLDIETFSTMPTASIITIGAIKFNRRRNEEPLFEEYRPEDVFYRRIDLSSCEDLGLHVDASTILWWNKQDEESKLEIFSTEDRHDIRRVMEEFVEWFGNSIYVWSHGSDFDVVIVENVLRKCGISCPWNFWNVRDTRTVCDLGNVKLSMFENNVKHHSLHDAHIQILCLKKALRNIRDI